MTTYWFRMSVGLKMTSGTEDMLDNTNHTDLVWVGASVEIGDY